VRSLGPTPFDSSNAMHFSQKGEYFFLYINLNLLRPHYRGDLRVGVRIDGLSLHEFEIRDLLAYIAY